MNTSDKYINNLFLYWLISCLTLVFFIIIIGGLTRLTNSGLSITEWELFTGLLPPLNDSIWELYFNQYKEIPQFKLLNFNMSLDEFKVIFYWEYIHRLLARIIGLFFLFPLLFFYFTKKINKTHIDICYKVFFLILLQGVIGWYMVKSGLVNDVTVSHFRLSIHLGIAFIIISIIFWLIQNIKKKTNVIFFKITKENLLKVLINKYREIIKNKIKLFSNFYDGNKLLKKIFIKEKKKSIANQLVEGVKLEDVFTLTNYWISLLDIFVISLEFKLPIIIFSSNNIPILYSKTKVFGSMDVNEFYLIKIKRLLEEEKQPQLGILKYKNKIKIKKENFKKAISAFFENGNYTTTEEYFSTFIEEEKKKREKRKE